MEAVEASSSPLFGVIAIIVVVISIIALVAWLKKAEAKQIAGMKEKFSGKTILVQSSANFFGQQSKGYRQSRGNGALLLTEEEFYFSLMIPANELSIPPSNIKGIKTGKSFLGKSKLRPLLIVEYMVDGEMDSAAWLVGDLSKWTDELNKLIDQQVDFKQADGLTS